MQENSNNSQVVRLGEILKTLKIDVTAEDRNAAVKRLDIAKSTISTYLKGRVLNNDTAVSLITFFKKRIADREKAIA